MLCVCRCRDAGGINRAPHVPTGGGGESKRAAAGPPDAVASLRALFKFRAHIPNRTFTPPAHTLTAHACACVPAAAPAQDCMRALSRRMRMRSSARASTRTPRVLAAAVATTILLLPR
eukprot:364704-Chlamydomonas_euryale.AAC.1